jgi:putative tricarboxylic transport membrane protein
MTISGFVGYVLKKLDFPLAPLALTLVLGPLLEGNLRRSLEMSNGSFRILVQSPIAVTVLCVAAVALVWPAVRLGISALRRRSADTTDLASAAQS